VKTGSKRESRVASGSSRALKDLFQAIDFIMTTEKDRAGQLWQFLLLLKEDNGINQSINQEIFNVAKIAISHY